MPSIWIHYLLTAYRSLRRHRVFFGINLMGLTLAISCALYAFIFIQDELRFDQHIQNQQGLYRLYKHHINIPEHVDINTYETSGMMGPTMAKEYPEVTSFSRVLPWWDPMIFSQGNRHIQSEKVYFVDSTFLEMFDVKMVAGGKKELLKSPSSILISERLAAALFGKDDPVGRRVLGINDLPFHIEGVFERPPRNGSLQYDALISWTTTVPNVGQMPQDWMNNWRAQGIFTFVKLAPNTSVKALEKKTEGMMQTHFEERAENYFLKLQPFQEMYLYGHHITHRRGMKTGNIQFLYLLGFSAALILLIASVNYINITLSRTSQTHKEVGIRRVMGSSRSQLAVRFIAETFIIAFLATTLSIAIVYLLIPVLNVAIGKDLEQIMLFEPGTAMSILAFIVAVSLLVGCYPALSLSGQALSPVLKSSAGTVKGTDWFRRTLMTLQYAISIFLIICTLGVINQTQFLLDRPLGFEQEQVMVIDINNEVGEKAHVLKANLLSHPDIRSVSIGRSAIGGGSYTTRVQPELYDGDMAARMFGIDFDFFNTYGIKQYSGRTFRKGSKADSSNAMMVNRAFMEFVGWEDPIGKKITFSSGNVYPIIGVTENFHISSLATTDIEPMIMFLNTRPMYASVKMEAQDLKATIPFIADQFEQLATKTPFDYYFVDQWFEDQYVNEQQVLSLSSVYAIISIVLCAMGLYGLTALILQQRKREISIRKVLGASLSSLLALLNKEFAMMMALAFVVAIPAANFLITEWLNQFVYRIDLGFGPFFMAGFGVIVISLAIVGLLTLRIGQANPSKNLSSE